VHKSKKIGFSGIIFLFSINLFLGGAIFAKASSSQSPLPISFGGTGAKTQTQALTNLGINNIINENSTNSTFPSAKAIRDFMNTKITKYFVAVGKGGLISSCPASKNCSISGNWTSKVVNSSSTTWISVTRGLDKFVALAEDGTIAYSADTVSWSLSKASNYTCKVEGTESDSPCKIRFLNNQFFMAGGASGKIIYSTNGINWSTIASCISKKLPGSSFGLGKYVFAGEDTYAAISSSPTSGYSCKQIGNGHIIEMMFGDKFVRSGTSGYIGYSTDGTNWSQYVLSDGGHFPTIIYVNKTYIGVRWQGRIYKSTSGTTAASWSYITVGSSAWFSIASSGAQYIVVGQNGAMAYSTNSTSWGQFTNGSTTWYGVTYG
jgi:hypothetical protein